MCYISSELGRCGNGWDCPNRLPEWARPDKQLYIACSIQIYAGDHTGLMSVGTGGYVSVYDFIPAGNTGARSHVLGCWPVNI